MAAELNMKQYIKTGLVISAAIGAATLRISEATVPYTALFDAVFENVVVAIFGLLPLPIGLPPEKWSSLK